MEGSLGSRPGRGGAYATNYAICKGHLYRPTPNVGRVTDIVLPCLDEAAALPWVLARIPPGDQAIVVDNGSRDGSAQLAAALGAAVVHCPQRGYGAAVFFFNDTATTE